MATITSIRLYSAGTFNSPDELATRCVIITLSDKEEVSVVGCYGGYEQYGALPTSYAFTQPVADHYTEWLNGNGKPRPFACLSFTDSSASRS